MKTILTLAAALLFCMSLSAPAVVAADGASGAPSRQAGPTLDETISFIKKYLNDDIGDGNKLVTEFKGNCTIITRFYSEGKNLPSEKKHSILFELYLADLKDVNSMHTSYNSLNAKMYLHLDTDKKVKRWITKYSQGNYYSKYEEGVSPFELDDTIPVTVKLEKAENVRKAVEHAVQLCGGTIEKELF